MDTSPEAHVGKGGTIQAGTIEGGPIQDGTVHVGTIQEETIETGAIQGVKIQSESIQVLGGETTKLRGDATNVGKRTTEERNRTTEAKEGATEGRKGALERIKCATELGKGSTESGKFPSDIRNRATEEGKSATKVGVALIQTSIIKDIKEPMKKPTAGDRSEDGCKTECLQHIDDSSPYEEDVVYGPEANLQEHYDNCRKNPTHEKFIPITLFGPQHLPPHYHKKSMFELVKALADLTVRLTVTNVSSNRPETFNETPYPRFKNRGQKGFPSYGTGRVVQVKKYTVTDGQPCPCLNCKQSSAVQEWSQIRITTATHVVFDDEEAQYTNVRWGYDSDSSQEISFCGLSAQGDMEGDVCNLYCVTHDLDFADSLAAIVANYKTLSQKVFKKYESTKEEEKLTIIISHPHGCPKQVSIGQWTHRTDIVKKEFKTVYVNSQQDGNDDYNDNQDDLYDDLYENDDDQYNDDDRNNDYDDQYNVDDRNDDYDDQYNDDDRNDDYDDRNEDYDDQYNDDDRNDEYDDQYNDDDRNDDYDDQYNDDDRNDDYDDQYNDDDRNDDYDDQYNDDDRNDDYDDQYNDDDRNDDYDDQYNDDDRNDDYDDRNDDYDDQYNDDDRNDDYDDRNDDYDDQYNDDDRNYDYDDQCNDDDYDDQYNDDDRNDDYDDSYNDDNEYENNYNDEWYDDCYEDQYASYSFQQLVNSHTCSKYIYTACTCPGTSGATVFLLGRDDWTTDHLHSLGTAEGNCSGFAFKNDL